MIFRPHRSHLAPRHHEPQLVREPAAMPLQSVSVYAALVDGLRLFDRGPIAAIAIGLAWVLALVVSVIPPTLVDSMPYWDDDRYDYAFDTAFAAVPVELAMLLTALLAYAVLGAPILVGVYASTIRSAREGTPTLRGIFSGFAQYPRAVVMGVLSAAATAIVCVIPVVGLILAVFVGTFMWLAMGALGDRHRGVADALSAAWAMAAGRLLTLVLLNVAASVVILIGIIPFGIGLVVTIPVMLMMLGVGYRDAAEAGGLHAALPVSEAV